MRALGTKSSFGSCFSPIKPSVFELKTTSSHRTRVAPPNLSARTAASNIDPANLKCLHHHQRQRRRPPSHPFLHTPHNHSTRNTTSIAASIENHLENSPDAAATSAVHFLSAFYRFTRPHTMLGTFVSVISVSLLALGPQPITAAATTALLQALTSALFMNICIVGINQIYDIQIDKVNKPYLPLAAGDFPVATGVSIVWWTGAMALAIGTASGSLPLLATLAGSLLLGIAYSTDVPFLRWKQHPLAAAACILAVRAILVQLGFFFHMQAALGVSSLTLTRPIVFATGFMLMFSIVIALFKDVPDVAGDEQAGVRTLSVRLGQKKVFWLCIILLEVAYAGAIGVSLCSSVAWSRLAGSLSHFVVGVLIFWRAGKTDLSSSKSIYACYMDVWKAFYAEYMLLPLLR